MTTPTIATPSPFEVEDQPPAWLAPVLADLHELLRLPPGWNSYKARPVSAQAVWGALQLLRSAMPDAAPKPAVVPTVRGGVQLEWHTRGIDLEVEALPDGRYNMAFEDERASVSWEHESTTDIEPVRAALSELARRSPSGG